MSEPKPNRDAFRCFLILAVLALVALLVSLVVAWNSRFMIMSLPAVPPKPAPAAEKTFLRFGVSSWTSAARLGVGVPRTSLCAFRLVSGGAVTPFSAESDAGAGSHPKLRASRDESRGHVSRGALRAGCRGARRAFEPHGKNDA